MIGASVLLSAVLWIGAPQIIRIFLGPGFEFAIPVMRIMALLPPLVSASISIGLQWMLPLGLDMAYNKIVFSAGVVDLVAVLFLGHRYAHLGTAWAIVICEAFVTTASYLLLRSNHLNPLTSKAISSSDEAGGSSPLAARIRALQWQTECRNSR
jgi:PST family polysaccharide transporter